MKRKIIAAVLVNSLLTICIAQPAKKTTDFSPTEKCLYGFLLKNIPALKAAETGQAVFYILQKDSLFLFQQNLAKADTPKIQSHLVYSAANTSANCSENDWRIARTEYIEAGKYRGNPVFSYQQYFDAFDPFNSDYAAVKQDGKWGFINSYGELIIPCGFTGIKPHAFGIWLKNEVGVKLYNLKTGKTSDMYSEISLTAPGILPADTRLTVVKRQNKMGMIDENLQLLVPLLYDNITLLAQKFLVGAKQEKVVLLSAYTGKEISQSYDKIRVSLSGDYLDEAVVKNGQTTIVKLNEKGETIQ